MVKTKKSKRFLSVLLAAVLLLTMVPMAAFSAFAADTPREGLTGPAVADGEWNHELGGWYVTMSVTGTNFVFIQTQDNQKFAFTPVLTAKKNQGVNSVRLVTVVFNPADGFEVDPVMWTLNEATEDSSLPTPLYSTLSGSVTSGPKTHKWNAELTFTADGAADYELGMDIQYMTGGTAMDMSSYSTEDEEPIRIGVKVVDARALFKTVARAEAFVAANSDKVDVTRKITNQITAYQNSSMLDGKTYHSQADFDKAAATLAAMIPADFAGYDDALNAANAILANSAAYPANIVANLQTEVAKAVEIHTKNYAQQAEVDAAEAALRAALLELRPTPVCAPNEIPIPDGTPVSYLYRNTHKNPAWSGTNFDPGDGVLYTLSRDKVYMDITEKLIDFEIDWGFRTTFSNASGVWSITVSGPISEEALNEKVLGGDSRQTWRTYFTYNPNGATQAMQNAAQNRYFNKAGGRQNESEITISGDLNESIINQVNSRTFGDNLREVKLGVHFGEDKAWQISSWETFSRWITDTGAGFQEPRRFTAAPGDTNWDAMPQEDMQFKLYVYTKADLMNAINGRGMTAYNGASNWDAWTKVLADARAVYMNREVNQTQIDNAQKAIDNFVFEFPLIINAKAVKVTDGVESDAVLAAGAVDVVSNGASVLGTNNYTDGATVVFNAVSNTADYVFLRWERADAVDTKDATLAVTMNAPYAYTAVFAEVPADYSKVEEQRGRIPQDMQTLYTPDSVRAVLDADAAVVKGLLKSQQSLVDSWADALKDAIDNLKLKDADYSDLDAAIKAAEDINKDWLLTDSAYNRFVIAEDNAKELSRDLTILDQGEIDMTAQELWGAIKNLHYLPADYTELDANIALVPKYMQNFYTEDSWNAYIAAREEAKKFSRDYLIYQQAIVDEAAAEMLDAYNKLTLAEDVPSSFTDQLKPKHEIHITVDENGVTTGTYDYRVVNSITAEDFDKYFFNTGVEDATTNTIVELGFAFAKEWRNEEGKVLNPAMDINAARASIALGAGDADADGRAYAVRTTNKLAPNTAKGTYDFACLVTGIPKANAVSAEGQEVLFYSYIKYLDGDGNVQYMYSGNVEVSRMYPGYINTCNAQGWIY